MMGAISVSLRADRLYIQALKALAYQKGLTIADLVRSAVDTTYGDELKPHLDFFCAMSEDKNPHSMPKILPEAEHGR